MFIFWIYKHTSDWSFQILYKNIEDLFVFLYDKLQLMLLLFFDVQLF